MEKIGTTVLRNRCVRGLSCVGHRLDCKQCGDEHYREGRYGHATDRIARGVGGGTRLQQLRSAPHSGATSAVVDAALDAGINFFDTADVYGGTKSEEFLGRTLSRHRDEVVLATKFGAQLDEQRKGASPEYVGQAVEDSLRRLRTDRIDLYQLHRPDPEVPIEDTLGALDELVRAGKVREIGCSNFSAEQLRAAEGAARDGAARFVSVQNEYSVLHREPERDVLSECERLGIAFIPYFPLVSGLLTGKYRQGQPTPEGSRLQSGRGDSLLTDQNFAIVEELIEFSQRYS